MILNRMKSKEFWGVVRGESKGANSAADVAFGLQEQIAVQEIHEEVGTVIQIDEPIVEQQQEQERVEIDQSQAWELEEDPQPMPMYRDSYDRVKQINTMASRFLHRKFRMKREVLRFDQTLRLMADEELLVLPDKENQKLHLVYPAPERTITLEEVGLKQWNEAVVTVVKSDLPIPLAILVEWRGHRGYIASTKEYPLSLWGKESLAEAYPVGSRWRALAYGATGTMIQFSYPIPNEREADFSSLNVAIGSAVQTNIVRLFKSINLAVLSYRGCVGWAWFRPEDRALFPKRKNIDRTQTFTAYITGIDADKERFSFSMTPILQPDETAFAVPLSAGQCGKKRLEAFEHLRTIDRNEQIAFPSIWDVSPVEDAEVVDATVLAMNDKGILLETPGGRKASLRKDLYAFGKVDPKLLVKVGDRMQVQVIDSAPEVMWVSRVALATERYPLHEGDEATFTVVAEEGANYVLRYDDYHYYYFLKDILQAWYADYQQTGCSSDEGEAEPAEERCIALGMSFTMPVVLTNAGLHPGIPRVPHPALQVGCSYRGVVRQVTDSALLLDCQGASATLTRTDFGLHNDFSFVGLYQVGEVLYDLKCLNYNPVSDVARMGRSVRIDSMWDQVCDLQPDEQVEVEVVRVAANSMLVRCRGFLTGLWTRGKVWEKEPLPTKGNRILLQVDKIDPSIQYLLLKKPTERASTAAPEVQPPVEAVAEQEAPAEEPSEAPEPQPIAAAEPVELKIGARVWGTIQRSYTKGYGVNLDGGAWGFVPRHELGWGLIGSDWNTRYKAGDRVEVIVSGVNEEKESYQLSIRRTLPDPLQRLAKQEIYVTLHARKDPTTGKEYIILLSETINYASIRVKDPVALMTRYRALGGGFLLPKAPLRARITKIDQERRVVWVALLGNDRDPK